MYFSTVSDLTIVSVKSSNPFYFTFRRSVLSNDQHGIKFFQSLLARVNDIVYFFQYIVKAHITSYPTQRERHLSAIASIHVSSSHFNKRELFE